MNATTITQLLRDQDLVAVIADDHVIVLKSMYVFVERNIKTYHPFVYKHNFEYVKYSDITQDELMFIFKKIVKML